MWVDGLAAYAPAPFTYNGQEGIVACLGAATCWSTSTCSTSTCNRPRIRRSGRPCAGHDRHHRPHPGGLPREVAPTTATTCHDAWAGLATTAESTGRLSVHAVAAAPPPDPCSPPGDPLAQVPDGLLRIEVLDHGSESTARFAWSFEDGANAVPIVSVAAAPSG
jgi:hypothetical protein